MKKIIFAFVFFAANFCIANPNIVCAYFASSNGWQAVPGYASFELNGNRTFGTVSMALKEGASGEAICSRFTEFTKESLDIFEQAHYILKEDEGIPDAKNCDLIEPDSIPTPAQTISRKKFYLSPGASAKVAASATQLIHYVPTSAELILWKTVDAKQLDVLVAEKCLTLLPGSILADSSEKPKFTMTVHRAE